METEEDKYLIEGEEKKKKETYAWVSKVSSEIYDIIVQIKELDRFNGMGGDISNIGVTLNNKIVQISKQFTDSGISMFQDEELKKIRVNAMPVLGMAIIDDLTLRCSDGIDKIAEYTEKAKKITNRQTALVVSNTKNPFKRFFNQIRFFFWHDKIQLTDYEKQDIKESIQDYERINEELGAYNLDDNLEDTIVRYYEKTSFERIQNFEMEMLPTLEKLGYAHMKESIEERLSPIEEDKQDRRSQFVREIKLENNEHENEEELSDEELDRLVEELDEIDLDQIIDELETIETIEEEDIEK